MSKISNSVRVVTPRVLADFPSGIKLEATSFTYIAAVNQAPRFSCNVVKTTGNPLAAVSMQSAEVCGYLGSLQERFFNTNSNEKYDCGFSVLMGDALVFSMEAKLNRANYSWGLTAPSMAHEAQGEVGCLAGLTMGIYDPTPNKREGDGKLFYLAKNYSPTANISNLFTDICVGIIERAGKVELPPETPQPDVVRELITMRNKTNALYLPVLYDIFEASDLQFPALTDKNFWGSHQENICNTIVGCLVNSQDGMAALSALCGEFGLLFIPDINGRGKLVRLDRLLEAPAETVLLDAAQLSAEIGSSGYLPARAVRVTMSNPAYYAGNPAEQAAGSSYGLARPVAQWPKDVDRGGSVGRVVSIPPPSWLNCAMTKLAADEVTANKSQDLNAVSEALDNLGKKLEDNAKATWDCLQDWARLCYIQEVLSSSAVVVQMPSPDWKTYVGKKVSFNSSDGGTLFTGLVMSETKTISGGENPSVMSSFQLSYVTFPGFNPVT